MTDLISRADAIEELMKLPTDTIHSHFDDGYSLGVEHAIAHIKALPQAEYSKILQTTLNGDLVSRADAIEALSRSSIYAWSTEQDLVAHSWAIRILQSLPSADAEWIPCSERLPKVNQRVLLATTDGRVFVGYREKPDLVWQVTEKDGRKHWVYDPENYTDDIEILPKNEDCGFAKDDVYSDGFLSVTSVNYDDRFEGVTAWMPLPKPYKGGDNE